MTGYEMAPEARKLPVSLKESPKLKIASNGWGLGCETTLSRETSTNTEVIVNSIKTFIVFKNEVG